MTSITFYGGVNEIGGNKILLQDKDTKIFLDFGKGFTGLSNYFEEYLAPRSSNGILDFITMGLVPDIPGIYRDDLMFRAGRELKEPEIAAKPDKYLCAMGFFSFNALIDMKPKSGAIYIHSASEAYNEEQVLSTKRLKNWIEKFQMEHHQIHCSGHAKGEDLMSMVKEIDAKMLFPVHTEYPTEYVRVTNKINIVELNREYII